MILFRKALMGSALVLLATGALTTEVPAATNIPKDVKAAKKQIKKLKLTLSKQARRTSSLEKKVYDLARQRSAQGVAGPQGVSGPQGERGLAGEKGVRGEAGPAGAAGLAGAEGPRGLDGSDASVTEASLNPFLTQHAFGFIADPLLFGDARMEERLVLTGANGYLPTSAIGLRIERGNLARGGDGVEVTSTCPTPDTPTQSSFAIGTDYFDAERLTKLESHQGPLSNQWTVRVEGVGASTTAEAICLVMDRNG